MITVSLIKELYFISAYFKREVQFSLSISEGFPIKSIIKPDGILNIWYRDNHIWQENVNGDDSFFGIESCDSISRIVNCIDNNDNTWRERYYFNESLK